MERKTERERMKKESGIFQITTSSSSPPQGAKIERERE